MEPRKPPNDESDALKARVETGSQAKLPDAATSPVETITVSALCVDGGPLLVTYERYSFRHRRDRYWAWRMKSVARAAPASASRPPKGGPE